MYASIVDCAAETLELQRATMTYLPPEAWRYGKCAELAQEVLAFADKPITPTRIAITRTTKMEPSEDDIGERVERQ